jgi:hypothetical protein
MNRQVVAKELVSVARELFSRISDNGTLVVPVGGKPVDPETGKRLEELKFTPEVVFSVLTQGTTPNGRPSRAIYRTNLHFKQFSPDRRYYWGRDATLYDGGGDYGPLIYMDDHWVEHQPQYLKRIEKALQYHFPIRRGVKRARLAPPYHTWVEYIRRPVYDFGENDDFNHGDVVEIFSALKKAVTN